jgi:hypothetical protein
MENVDNFMYMTFASIYFYLFIYFFNKKVEFLVFIFITIMYIFFGFKIIIDLYLRPYLVLNFNFVEIFNTGIFKFITSILFHPFVIITISLLLLFNIFSFFAGKSVNILYLIIQAIIIGLFMLINSNLLTFAKYPLWIIFSIPIILNSLGLFIVSYYTSAFINKNRENLTLDVSKHNRKLLSKYKVALITNTLLISILLSLNLFGQTPPSRYVSYLFFSSIYGTSGYLMFLSYEITNIQKIETAINELKTC